MPLYNMTEANQRIAEADRDVLSALIAISGLSIAEFARTVVGRDERTVRRWLSGEVKIPEQAAAWLGLAEVRVTSKRVTITVTRP